MSKTPMLDKIAKRKNTLKNFSVALEKYRAWRREKEHLSETDRQRLILQILASREKEGLTQGTTLSALTGMYQAISLDRMSAAQSTLSAEIQRLKKGKYVTVEKNPKDGRQILIKVAENGWALLKKLDELQEERLEIYLEVLKNDEEKIQIVMDFYADLVKELNKRMNQWQDKFGVSF